MKGTRLWQGAGSPLIQGRSRQLRPLWQPWLGAVLLTVVASNAVALWVYKAVPVEFFAVGSGFGALAGVWVARRLGWRTAWALGAVVGACTDVVAFAAVSNWLSWALFHVNKVG